jgi:hypothetical protein
MAGKSDFLENAILALIFNATASATLFQNNVTSPLTNLYVSLHTADPTDSGLQNTNETAYTGYARIAVARTSGGWTVSGSNPTQVAPVANIDFGQCSASPGGAITHFGIGVAASGATSLLYAGTVTPNIAVAVGVIPRLTTASTITED